MKTHTELVLLAQCVGQMWDDVDQHTLAGEECDGIERGLQHVSHSAFGMRPTYGQ
jgi:hypothetical protein